jgi:ABC-type iron transport system FetAB permease component
MGYVDLETYHYVGWLLIFVVSYMLILKKKKIRIKSDIFALGSLLVVAVCGYIMGYVTLFILTDTFFVLRVSISCVFILVAIYFAYDSMKNAKEIKKIHDMLVSE